MPDAAHVGRPGVGRDGVSAPPAARPAGPRSWRSWSVACLLFGVAAMIWVARRTGAALGAVAFVLPLHSHLLALGLVVLDLGCRSLRFRVLARAAGAAGTTLGLAARVQLAGEAAASVTPSRAGAEPAKATLLGREGVPPSASGAAMVGEMVAEIATLTVVATALAVALPAGRGVALGALSYALVVVSTTGTAILLSHRRRGESPPALWRWLGLSRARWSVLGTLADGFRERLAGVRHAGIARTATILGCTLLHMAARVSVLATLVPGSVLRSHPGAVLAWPLLLLYGGALVPLPGGGGLLELGFAAGLGGVLPRSSLAGILVWWRIYTFYLPALAGGGVWILSGLWRPQRAAA